MARHIVVGLDGSTGSAAAARWCAEIAPLLDADVVGVAGGGGGAGVNRSLAPAPVRRSASREGRPR